jgi:hypothetical protein
MSPPEFTSFVVILNIVRSVADSILPPDVASVDDSERGRQFCLVQYMWHATEM